MTWQAQLYNLKDSDLDRIAWRYLTFPKFVSLLSYGALWFQRLCYLPDLVEGTIPKQPMSSMKQEDESLKQVFTDPAYQAQIGGWHERNVLDGKSLTLANCWYLGDTESERMWEEYGQSHESVAVRTTIRKLRMNTFLPADFSFIGPVRYIDHATYEMDHYSAHQAHHRAFLKDRRDFVHEQELRMTTLNIRSPACLDALGRPLTQDDLSGTGTNNFESAGLHIRVNLPHLLDTIVTHPKAPEWFYNLVLHLQLKSGFEWSVQRSTLK
jgi:hypothetical protein